MRAIRIMDSCLFFMGEGGDIFQWFSTAHYRKFYMYVGIKGLFRRL